MSTLFLLILFFQLLSLVVAILFDGGIKKCYGELGCFTLSGDFSKRPVQLLPLGPAIIRTKFLLNTRLNPLKDQYLGYNNENLDECKSKVQNSHFNGSKNTRIIVHGFLDYGTRKWMMDMYKEFLTYEDCNVIRVDWGAGSKIPYTQATANTRVVGAQIAELIKRLEDWAGADRKKFHILGHSLGSHIAGYAGERLAHKNDKKQLGMITGLDPAEPYFQGYGPQVILDPTDALFVEGIHTDGESIYDIGNDIGKGDRGFGMSDPVGHFDFYPNNGQQQPGCSKTLVEKIINGGIVTGMEDFVACSHMRVTKLYTETINSPCPFMSYTCSSYANFQNGHCLNNENGMYLSMGPRSRNMTPQMKTRYDSGDTKIKLYLSTGDATPYCRYNYRVDVGLSYSRGEELSGKLRVDLVGNLGRTLDTPLSTSVEYLYPGERHLYLLLTQQPIGHVNSVHFWWDYSWSVINPGKWPILKHPKLFIRNIRVNSDNFNRTEYCGYDDPIEAGRKYKSLLFAATTKNKRCPDEKSFSYTDEIWTRRRSKKGVMQMRESKRRLLRRDDAVKAALRKGGSAFAEISDLAVP